ncbi:MAG: hypothetical protein Q8P15_00290 [Nanoarchaeota archaeon]|nr:hypothetical protein [Nanoarchaeota archaeon]
MLKQKHNNKRIIEINRKQHYKQSSDFTLLMVSESNLMDGDVPLGVREDFETWVSLPQI